MSNSSKSTGGIVFAGLLAIAFIILKLTGLIAWSWWWVLSPIWIPMLVVVGALVGITLIFYRK